MASKINKILFFFILLTGISFPQLTINCGNELPSDNSSYEKYLNCKSKGGYDDYFIGDVSSRGEKSLDKKRSLSDLSNSISVYIESSLDESFYQDEVSYTRDGEIIEQFNVEHYLVHTLKSESNNNIKNPIFRELLTSTGVKHYVTFKSKQEFADESDEINNEILDQLKSYWQTYQNSVNDSDEKYQSLITSYLLSNCVSGASFGDDKAVLKEILKIKKDVYLEFENYLSGINFENSSKTTLQVSVGERIDEEFKINITTEDKNAVVPSKVKLFINTGEFQKSIFTNSKKNFSFKIPVINSSTSNQIIYFYPDLPPIPQNEIIGKKLENEKNKLISHLKKRSESNDFGSMRIKVDQKISLYFNEQEIVNFFENNNFSMIFNNETKTTIVDYIVNQGFKNISNVKISKKAENIINIPISFEKGKKDDKYDKIVFTWSDKLKSKFSLRSKKTLNYSARRIDSNIDFDKQKSNLISIIRNLVNRKIKTLKKVNINCLLCSKDEIKIYTSTSGTKTVKGKDSYLFDKGSIEKIEFFSKTGRQKFKYLTIHSRDIDKSLLFSNTTIELSDILKNYLVDKNLYDNNENLIEGSRICFQEKNITYNATIPPEYLSKKIKVIYNGEKQIIQDDGSVVINKKNTDKGNLIFEANGLSIKKSLNNKDNTIGSLRIKPFTKIDRYNDKPIYLEWQRSKPKFSDIFIPGMSNINLLRAEKNSTFWGYVKMLTFATLAGIIINESDLYNEHSNQYNQYKQSYNNCLDCPVEQLSSLRIAATESYDLMTDHQLKQNVAMIGLASLYTYNIIEFSIKLGNKRKRK